MKTRSVLLLGCMVVAMVVAGVFGRQFVRTMFRPQGQETRSSSTPEMTPRRAAELAVGMANSAVPPGTEFEEGVLYGQGAEVAADDLVRYKYELRIPPEEISSDWINEMRETLPGNYCRLMKSLHEQGVSAEWRYQTSEGEEILVVRARPEDCS